MTPKQERFDRNRLKPVSVRDVKHKVRVEQFGKSIPGGASADELLRSLPDILAARNLNRAIDAVVHANQEGAPVLLLFGAHVIKVGLAPALIPLIRDGIVSGIATNGAGAIHDWEIAWNGSTSENVSENLDAGIFGMAEETSAGIHGAIRAGLADDLGLGESLGRAIDGGAAPHRKHSFLSAAYETGTPFTVHVGIGTDIIHMHKDASGEDLGRASYNDFLTLVSLFEKLTDHSVLLHVGSAVILPEVSLKAVAMLRNAGSPPGDYLAVDFDMNSSYRPLKNVLSRPAGDGIHITGHHEIMLPLFVAGIYARLERYPG